ncbi:hypothetical protein [Isoptericola sp. NPDC056134]|uniref:hypothetical protein n=1 Tax=Isoptericola sp. NPDC056134 TaxID=3345723 RepID=UPI0035ED8A98
MSVSHRLVRTGALAAFGLLVGLATVAERQVRASIVSSGGIGELNGWDVLLSSLGNPYLLCYLAIPAFLFGISAMVETRARPEELLRHGSRTAAAGAMGLTGFAAVVPFVGVWTLVATGCAAGLPWGRGWSSAALSGGHQLDLATTDLVGLGSPLVALVIQLSAVLVSAWAATVACATVRLWTVGPRALRYTCVGVALWTIVSFAMMDGAPGLLRAINYVDVAHAVATTGAALPFLATTAAVGGLLLLVNLLLERRGRVRRG